MKITIKLEGETDTERFKLAKDWRHRVSEAKQREEKGMIKVPVKLDGVMFLRKLYPCSYGPVDSFTGGEVEFLFEGKMSDGICVKVCPSVSPKSGQEAGR